MHGIRPLALACTGSHVATEVVPSRNGFSSCRTPPSPPAHADTNQAQQPEWNTNVECLCRAALASASSPGISVPRKPQRSQDSINHATPPRASQALRVGFGRKTHARFQCLLVKLGSYSSAVGRIKTPKGILFDQGGFKSKEK